MKLKVSDIILITILLTGVIISAIFIYMPKKNPESKELYAVVEVDRKVVDEIDFLSLESENSYTYEGLYTEVVVKADKEGIWVVKSGCKDQVCVKHTKISALSEQIICAPNLFMITIYER